MHAICLLLKNKQEKKSNKCYLVLPKQLETRGNKINNPKTKRNRLNLNLADHKCEGKR